MRTQLSSAAVLAAVLLAGPATSNGDDNKKLESGLTPTVRLLQLMDTDKNGKVSKEEFMRFMQAEFDFADKNHDGELDPKELEHFVQGLRHPHPIEPPGR